MQNNNQNHVANAQKAFIALLSANRELLEPTPGEFADIPRKAFNPAVNLPDLRIFVDDSVKAKAKQLNYIYVPSLSNEDKLIFLDITPARIEYDNGFDIVTFIYNFDTEQVEKIVLEEHRY